MEKNESVRQAAVRSLVSYEKNGKYSNLEVASSLEKSLFSDADKRLYTRLVYGVIERKVTLDHIISQLSSRELSKIDMTTLCCLRVGIYQLLFSDKIPDHAAVSETVDSAPRQSKGFVNALLREFIRKEKAYSVPDDRIKKLSVNYSCPEELCNFFLEAYPGETGEKIIASTVGKAPVYIRVNTLCSTSQELKNDIFPDGEITPFADDVISTERVVFDGNDPRWFVEDLSSRLAVKVLGALPGETVVDTCAAPGGKSFSAAMDMKNEGKIYSFDLHGNKVSLIKKGAERLGIKIIEADARDAREPLESLVGKADRVLCDAPCSGLGVIAKKPDIKYKSLNDIERLPDIQLSVLKGASAYVRCGGVLVYSTCTLNPKENSGVIERFLSENPDFQTVGFSLGSGLDAPDGMLTIFPFDADSDGFFIARMMKKE